MTNEEAKKMLEAFKNYLTAGNPIWHKDEVAEAFDLAIAALERDRWISVEEQPNIGWYLVICNQWGGRIHRLAFCRDGIWTEWTDMGYDITEYVTHYRPLPEPPKEET